MRIKLTFDGGFLPPGRLWASYQGKVTKTIFPGGFFVGKITARLVNLVRGGHVRAIGESFFFRERVFFPNFFPFR